MAVNFVVEDGSGKSDATSYISVADADQVITDYGLAWPAGYTDDQKKVALNNGTRYLDTKYNGAWKGYKNSETQALAWPRADVTDADGWYIDSNIIPAQVEQATVEVAVYFAENGAAFPDLDNPGALKMQKIKIDVIEIQKEFLGGNSGTEVAGKVDAILNGLLKSAGANSEVTRG